MWPLIKRGAAFLAIAVALWATTAPIDISRQTRNIVWVNGQPVSAVGAINITSPPASSPGCGVVWSIAPAVNRTDVSASVNSACALTIGTAQSGAPIFCGSSNGTTGYTCSFSGTRRLQAYTVGMFVVLRPDVSNAGAASLNIDALGIHSIKQRDGTTDPASGQLLSGQFYWLFYDGSVWRMQ